MPRGRDGEYSQNQMWEDIFIDGAKEALKRARDQKKEMGEDLQKEVDIVDLLKRALEYIEKQKKKP